MDRRGYGQALRPLQNAILSGEISPIDPSVWQVRFGIRNNRYRPTYAELGEMVARALRLSAPAEARNVVTTPKPLALPPGPTPKEAPDAKTYRPDYERLPADPREWRRDLFESGREFYCALSAAMRDRRIVAPAASPAQEVAA